MYKTDNYAQVGDVDLDLYEGKWTAIHGSYKDQIDSLGMEKKKNQHILIQHKKYQKYMMVIQNN